MEVELYMWTRVGLQASIFLILMEEMSMLHIKGVPSGMVEGISTSATLHSQQQGSMMGGVYNSGGGIAAIRNSSFTSCTALYQAISNAATLTVQNCHFISGLAGNIFDTGFGGAISNHQGGILDIDSTTFDSNTVLVPPPHQAPEGDGGAIWNSGSMPFWAGLHIQKQNLHDWWPCIPGVHVLCLYAQIFAAREAVGAERSSVAVNRAVSSVPKFCENFSMC